MVMIGKVYFLYIICLLLCFAGCKNTSQTKTGEEELPVIDLEQALNNNSCIQLKLSEFVDSIGYIPLETNYNSHIGDKGRLFMTDQHIFYNDLMFGIDGKFVRKIGKNGKGPGEYLVARGMSADEQYQEFYIYDNFGYRVMIHDLNGTFKRAVPVSGFGSGVIPIGNRYFYMGDDAGYGPDMFNYCILHIGEGDTIRLKKTEKVKELSTSGTNNYGLGNSTNWNYNHSFNYYEFLSDTIYTISPLEEIARYVVKFGKYKIPFNQIAEVRGNAIYDHARITKISESANYIFFSIMLKQKLYYAYFNKETKETQAGIFNEVFINDIDGGPTWLFDNSEDGSVGFYYLTPEWAKENLEIMFRKNEGYNKMKSERLKKMVDQSDEEDNPIVYIFHFK